MATETLQKIRLAEVAPAGCSSCFNQAPDARHVDFNSFFDGPVLDGSKALQIDDLVICEQCMTEAASLLGLRDQAKLEERLQNAAQRIAEAEAKNERQAAVIQGLKLQLDNAEPLKARKAR